MPLLSRIARYKYFSCISEDVAGSRAHILIIDKATSNFYHVREVFARAAHFRRFVMSPISGLFRFNMKTLYHTHAYVKFTSISYYITTTRPQLHSLCLHCKNYFHFRCISWPRRFQFSAIFPRSGTYRQWLTPMAFAAIVRRCQQHQSHFTRQIFSLYFSPLLSP